MKQSTDPHPNEWFTNLQNKITFTLEELTINLNSKLEILATKVSKNPTYYSKFKYNRLIQDNLNNIQTVLEKLSSFISLVQFYHSNSDITGILSIISNAGRTKSTAEYTDDQNPTMTMDSQELTAICQDSNDSNNVTLDQGIRKFVKNEQKISSKDNDRHYYYNKDNQINIINNDQQVNDRYIVDLNSNKRQPISNRDKQITPRNGIEKTNLKNDSTSDINSNNIKPSSNNVYNNQITPRNNIIMAKSETTGKEITSSNIKHTNRNLEKIIPSIVNRGLNQIVMEKSYTPSNNQVEEINTELIQSNNSNNSNNVQNQEQINDKTKIISKINEQSNNNKKPSIDNDNESLINNQLIPQSQLPKKITIETNDSQGNIMGQMNKETDRKLTVDTNFSLETKDKISLIGENQYEIIKKNKEFIQLSKNLKDNQLINQNLSNEKENEDNYETVDAMNSYDSNKIKNKEKLNIKISHVNKIEKSKSNNQEIETHSNHLTKNTQNSTKTLSRSTKNINKNPSNRNISFHDRDTIDHSNIDEEIKLAESQLANKQQLFNKLNKSKHIHELNETQYGSILKRNNTTTDLNKGCDRKHNNFKSSLNSRQNQNKSYNHNNNHNSNQQNASKEDYHNIQNEEQKSSKSRPKKSSSKINRKILVSSEIISNDEVIRSNVMSFCSSEQYGEGEEKRKLSSIERYQQSKINLNEDGDENENENENENDDNKQDKDRNDRNHNVKKEVQKSKKHKHNWEKESLNDSFKLMSFVNLDDIKVKGHDFDELRINNEDYDIIDTNVKNNRNNNKGIHQNINNKYSREEKDTLFISRNTNEGQSSNNNVKFNDFNSNKRTTDNNNIYLNKENVIKNIYDQSVKSSNEQQKNNKINNDKLITPGLKRINSIPDSNEKGIIEEVKFKKELTFNKDKIHSNSVKNIKFNQEKNKINMDHVKKAQTIKENEKVSNESEKNCLKKSAQLNNEKISQKDFLSLAEKMNKLNKKKK